MYPLPAKNGGTKFSFTIRSRKMCVNNKPKDISSKIRAAKIDVNCKWKTQIKKNNDNP